MCLWRHNGTWVGWLFLSYLKEWHCNNVSIIYLLITCLMMCKCVRIMFHLLFLLPTPLSCVGCGYDWIFFVFFGIKVMKSRCTASFFLVIKKKKYIYNVSQSLVEIIVVWINYNMTKIFPCLVYINQNIILLQMHSSSIFSYFVFS